MISCRKFIICFLRLDPLMTWRKKDDQISEIAVCKGMKSYLESQTNFSIYFFDHTFHTHMSTYFQTQDHYQNIHCKQTADNKSNNKIAALLTLELICFPSKLSSINSRLKSGLFTLQLMGSLWVVQGRWIWEDSLRWGSLTQQLWRRREDYWWWTC